MARLVVIGFALALALTSKAEASCNADAFFKVGKHNGTALGLVVSDKDLAKAPPWTPGHGEPPLPAGRALEAASRWASANWKGFDSLHVESISLRPVGCVTTNDRWAYVIFFFMPSPAKLTAGTVVYDDTYFVGVLMDGSVVAPTPVKRDF